MSVTEQMSLQYRDEPVKPVSRIKIDSKFLANVRSNLKSMPEEVTYRQYPFFADLCTCLGLYRELGDPSRDRLSPYFGIDIGRGCGWDKSIEIHGRRVHLVLRPKNSPIGQSEDPVLKLGHADLRYILDPRSLNTNIPASRFEEHRSVKSGFLDKVVIDPRRVVEQFSLRGLDLVIVRDWLLPTLADNGIGGDHYLYINIEEVVALSGLQLARLISRKRLAFSGTHDIVDHLLGYNEESFFRICSLADRVIHVIEKHCLDIPRTACKTMATKLEYLAYLVGILLDDMVQPRWYQSDVHALAVEYILEIIEDLTRHGRSNSYFSLEQVRENSTEIVHGIRSGVAPALTRHQINQYVMVEFANKNK